MGTAGPGNTKMGARGSNGSSGSIWTVVTVSGGIIALLLQALWLVVWSGLNGQIADIKHTIEVEQRLIRQDFARSGDINRIDQDVAGLRTRLQNMDSRYETKDAFQGKHDALTDEVKRQSARIDELQKNLGAAYTLGDKFKEIQDQIRLLSDRTFRLGNNAPAALPAVPAIPVVPAPNNPQPRN